MRLKENRSTRAISVLRVKFSVELTRQTMNLPIEIHAK